MFERYLKLTCEPLNSTNEHDFRSVRSTKGTVIRQLPLMIETNALDLSPNAICLLNR
jgi:hypothetical protein